MATSLPAVAIPAWSAYTAMSATKQRHLMYLRHLEEKYKKYGRPSAAETNTLSNLLHEHDAQVKVFKKAVQDLKTNDPQAYAALIDNMVEERDLPH